MCDRCDKGCDRSHGSAHCIHVIITAFDDENATAVPSPLPWTYNLIILEGLEQCKNAVAPSK